MYVHIKVPDLFSLLLVSLLCLKGLALTSKKEHLFSGVINLLF